MTHHATAWARRLPGVRLADQQVFNIHTQAFGINGVKRMLGIYEGTSAASLLGFCNYLQRERGFS